jgi:hypothetical protein
MRPAFLMDAARRTILVQLSFGPVALKLLLSQGLGMGGLHGDPNFFREPSAIVQAQALILPIPLHKVSR